MPETTTAKRYVGDLTSSSATLYTAPASTTVRISHLRVATATAASITIQHFNGTSSFNLLNSYSVAANSYEDIFDLMLEAGDEIRGQTASVGDADYAIYLLETLTT